MRLPLLIICSSIFFCSSSSQAGQWGSKASAFGKRQPRHYRGEIKGVERLGNHVDRPSISALKKVVARYPEKVQIAFDSKAEEFLSLSDGSPRPLKAVYGTVHFPDGRRKSFEAKDPNRMIEEMKRFLVGYREGVIGVERLGSSIDRSAIKKLKRLVSSYPEKIGIVFGSEVEGYWLGPSGSSPLIKAVYGTVHFPDGRKKSFEAKDPNRMIEEMKRFLVGYREGVIGVERLGSSIDRSSINDLKKLISGYPKKIGIVFSSEVEEPWLGSGSSSPLIKAVYGTIHFPDGSRKSFEGKDPNRMIGEVKSFLSRAR